MKTKKRLIVICLVLVGIFVFAACGGNDAPAQPDQPTQQEQPAAPTPAPTQPDAPTVGAGQRIEGGELNVSLMSFPPSLTMTRNDSASAQFSKQIFEPLVHLYYSATDASLAPTPGLAESWEFIDGQTLAMRLRPGVLFHNGASLTSADVQFSIHRAMDNPEAAVVTEMIDRIEIVDDLNFIVHLHFPFAAIVSNLGHTITGILHMDSYLANPEQPVGTGPFMFDYLVIDNYIRLNRFDDYWGTPAIVDTLFFRLIADGSIRVIEADAGNIHISLDIQPAQRRAAEESTTATLLRRDNLSMNYIGFNMSDPDSPFANPLVRRAINYAIDVEGIIEAVFEGVGRPLQGVPLSDVNRDFTPGLVAPMPFDLNRARELMIEAGYADGFSGTIWYNIPNTARATIGEMVAGSLRQIGIELTVEGFEWELYLDRTSNFEHDMFILGWVSVVGDLDYALYPLFHSSQLGAPGNRFGLQSARLDDYLDRARVETDPAERIRLFQQAMILLDEYLPMALLNQGEFLVHAHHSAGGFVLNPGGHHSFARVYLTQ
jgi:peptide/nickel transport system substrate-binding protein